jgi:hypothetical protein
VSSLRRHCAGGDSDAGDAPSERGRVLFDHGHDVRADPTWCVQTAMDRVDVTVLEEEPPCLGVRLACGGESVVAVVGADAGVRDVRREPTES